MVQIGPEPFWTLNDGPKKVKQRNDAALETPRRADADQLPVVPKTGARSGWREFYS